jgi:hypothetical protein
MKAFKDPNTCMEGKCSVVPPYLIAGLFIYHLATFKKVAADEWYHHVIFGGGIATTGIAYCPGPIQNAVAFFINGLPGGGVLYCLSVGTVEALVPVKCWCW